MAEIKKCIAHTQFRFSDAHTPWMNILFQFPAGITGANKAYRTPGLFYPVSERFR